MLAFFIKKEQTLTFISVCIIKATIKTVTEVGIGTYFHPKYAFRNGNPIWNQIFKIFPGSSRTYSKIEVKTFHGRPSLYTLCHLKAFGSFGQKCLYVLFRSLAGIKTFVKFTDGLNPPDVVIKYNYSKVY
jgi:hypothetical protein